MSAFDKVIGYDNVKKEQYQIIDMINKPEKYREIGAVIPKGLLLTGSPGVGKTLMATAFLEECGFKSYIIRLNNFDKDVFDKAKENAPSVILIDDMDMFSNNDSLHRDAKEYALIQAGIDDVKDSKVFIIATANEIDKLPDSLVRPGRFDRIIDLDVPEDDDAEKIIKHYFSGKKISKDVNMEDVSKMISYSSCAALETIINEAAIDAVYTGRSEIEMCNIVNAVLKVFYHLQDNTKNLSSEDIHFRAIHEAGHLVVSEVLSPSIVGLATINDHKKGSNEGFIHFCRDIERASFVTMISLGGKCATEMKFAETVASGCRSDINRAKQTIRDGISSHGTCGLGFLDMESFRGPRTSDVLNSRIETVSSAEMERYMLKTRDLLIKNSEFLEAAYTALMEKGTLLFSDIRAIRESVKIIPVYI